MRWVTYRAADGDDRAGLVVDDEIRAVTPGMTVLDLLESGPNGLAVGEQQATRSPSEVVPLAGATLQAPVRPRSLRDCTGFLQHLKNCASAANVPVDERHTRYPLFYFSNVAATLGPHADVPIAPGSERFDFELEIGAVIGRSGSNIARDSAEDHIAGYTVLCDWSARDLQIDEMDLRLGPAKSKDTANTLGPMLVTPDELAPYRSENSFDLGMTGYVNGELVSEGRWDSVDWGFADMVTYAARGTTLRPGDVIGSGTVPTGCLFEHFAMDPAGFRGWLRPGDEVRLVVEELGEIRQRIVEGVRVQPLSSGY